MLNYNRKRSDEPVWWGLFSAGGTWFAMVTPVTVLFLGILVPLGIIDPATVSWDRVSDFASSFLGGCFVIGTLALPMWHGMHRVHHAMHDLKIHAGVWGPIFCYFTAGLVSALSLIFLWML